MESILIGAVLLTLLVFLALVVLVLFRLRAEYMAIVEQFRAYVSPESEGQPSPLAKTLELTADMMARSLVAQAKTFLMAQQSAEVRSANAQADASNPIAQVLPRSLRRNTLAQIATQFLMSKFAPGINQAVLSGGNGQAESSSPKFKL